MPDAQAFVGVALSDSEGGSVLVRINIEQSSVNSEELAADPMSAWAESVADDEMSEEQLAADAAADYTTDENDPASANVDTDDVSEQFDEGDE